MTINLEIKKTEVTEQKIELPVPCFFASKCGTKYIGLLDEATVVEITTDEYENCIRNYNNKKWGAGMDRIKEAYLTYHSCTESEFLDKHYEIEKAMSQHPILVP